MNLNDTFRAGMANAQTTLGGTALAAGYYGANVGFQLPHNGNEWASLGLSLLIQLVFMLCKDATTGSRPQ